jgi:hypothetical protein
MQEFLDIIFPGQCVGWDGPVSWPLCFTSITHQFFLLGLCKRTSLSHEVCVSE